MNSGLSGVLGGWDPIPLTGTVTIEGLPQVGQELTANTSYLIGTGNISYQWIRGGIDIDSATNNTYILTAADVGHNISVKVVTNENSGSVTSNVITVLVSITSPLVITFNPVNLTPGVTNDSGAIIYLTNIGPGRPDEITFSISGGSFSNPIWYYNNEPLGNNNSITLSSSDTMFNTAGDKLITLDVLVGGIPFTRVISFRVEP